jgi:Protein of unknown function (DUF4239)
MSSLKISVLVFSFLFGGALVGIYVSPFLPVDHTKGVQVSIGLLTTMFGLLFSLQLSSGKTYFDTQEQEVMGMRSKTVLLDNVLAHYGPEAKGAREALRNNVDEVLNQVWPRELSSVSTWAPTDEESQLYEKIQQLSPNNETQRSEKTLALGIAIDLRRTRWISAARIRSSTAVPLMVMEVAWATLIFSSFGLLATHSVTAIVSLALCAFAVSGGFFLIVEMNTPFSGLIKVSSAPIRDTFKQLAQ